MARILTKTIDAQLKRQLVEDYKSGVLTRELKQRYKISYWNTLEILRGAGIDTKKGALTFLRNTTFDINFFKKIDNDIKSYWLGFLYADFGITSQGISTSLNLQDIELINKFKEDIRYTGSPTFFEKILDGGKIETYIRFVISSVELRKDLINLGCIPRKSFTLTFPNSDIVSDSLVRHFIRGYFDGNGCVYINPNASKETGTTRGYITIVGAKNLIDGIKTKVVELTNIKQQSIKVSNVKHSPGISLLRIFRMDALKIFKDFLYVNSTRHLTRKKDKYYSLDLERKNGYDKLGRRINVKSGGLNG